MRKKEKGFDYEEALERVKAGDSITGRDGVLAPLLKDLTEAALEAEIESHLADDVLPNRRNGKTRKTLKTSAGKIELKTPRDRGGRFEPQIVKKNQTSVTEEIESKILSMYGRGMSYSDIREHIEEIYGISVSNGALNAITDKIIERVSEWQQRPLDEVYPFMWLDAIHFKVKEEGRYQSSVYGIGVESGRKEGCFRIVFIGKRGSKLLAERFDRPQ